MIRTTPHGLRRGLFFLNLALTASLALPAWLLLEDPPAADASSSGAARIDYVAARRTGLRWTPDRPVADADFRRTFLRFEGQTPAHWPFVGPLPPEPDPAAGDTPTPDEPEDLAALAHVHLVILGEGQPVVGFTFHGPPRARVEVGPGEPIRPRGSRETRFRLLAVERIEARLHHVHYEVMDGERVEREAYLVLDRRGKPGGGTGKGSGGIRLRSGEGPDGPSEDARAPGERGPSTIVVEVGAEATLETMRPTRHIHPRNRRDRVIEFDAHTYRVTRGKGLGAIFAHVKTTPAVDAATGRPIGIRIAGIGDRLPADRFDVRKGDILVSIAGQRVTTRADVIRIAQGIDPQTLVPIVIDRQGLIHTYRVDARDPTTKRKIRYFDNVK